MKFNVITRKILHNKKRSVAVINNSVAVDIALDAIDDIDFEGAIPRPLIEGGKVFY